MIEENELMVLIIGVVAIFIIVSMKQRNMLGFAESLLPGFYLMMGSYAFTIVEGFVWKSFFNALEHLCLVLSGIFFAYAIRKKARQIDRGGNDAPR